MVKRIKPGRPRLPADQRKARIDVTLHPQQIKFLRSLACGNASEGIRIAIDIVKRIQNG